MAVSEKRMTFNREFREARKAFEENPTEKNYTFTSKVDSGKKTILKKGETKQGLMKKFKSKSKSAAPTKTTDSTPGFLKRKAAGTRIVKNTKLADVTKQELNAWKEKNKGLYKGKALTAYLNAKGKNLSEPKTAGQKAAQALVYKKYGGKPVVDPKGQDVGKDYYTFPEDISGYSRKEMLEIIDKGKTPRRSIGASSFAGKGKGRDEKSKPKAKPKVKAKVSATQKPPSVKKLEAFKAGTLTLDQRAAFRLIKSLKRYNETNPKDKVIIPKKLIDLGRM